MLMLLLQEESQPPPSQPPLLLPTSTFSFCSSGLHVRETRQDEGMEVREGEGDKEEKPVHDRGSICRGQAALIGIPLLATDASFHNKSPAPCLRCQPESKLREGREKEKEQEEEEEEDDNSGGGGRGGGSLKGLNAASLCLFLSHSQPAYQNHYT